MHFVSRPNIGYAIDGSCEGNPGTRYYRCIDLSNGQTIFKQGPFMDSTNNIMEFLALIHALAYCKTNKINVPIYTDSITALAWLRNKIVNTRLKRTNRNSKTFELLDRAISWMYNNSWNTEILKWE